MGRFFEAVADILGLVFVVIIGVGLVAIGVEFAKALLYFITR